MDSVLRTAQANHERANLAPSPLALTDGAILDVIDARLLKPYQIRVRFSDGTAQTVDFGRFLHDSRNPHIRKYLDASLFADFTVENGDLHWHGYELCFSIADLYENRI